MSPLPQGDLKEDLAELAEAGLIRLASQSSSPVSGTGTGLPTRRAWCVEQSLKNARKGDDRLVGGAGGMPIGDGPPRQGGEGFRLALAIE